MPIHSPGTTTTPPSARRPCDAARPHGVNRASGLVPRGRAAGAEGTGTTAAVVVATTPTEGFLVVSPAAASALTAAATVEAVPTSSGTFVEDTSDSTGEVADGVPASSGLAAASKQVPSSFPVDAAPVATSAFFAAAARVIDDATIVDVAAIASGTGIYQATAALVVREAARSSLTSPKCDVRLRIKITAATARDTIDAPRHHRRSSATSRVVGDTVLAHANAASSDGGDGDHAGCLRPTCRRQVEGPAWPRRYRPAIESPRGWRLRQQQHEQRGDHHRDLRCRAPPVTGLAVDNDVRQQQAGEEEAARATVAVAQAQHRRAGTSVPAPPRNVLFALLLPPPCMQYVTLRFCLSRKGLPVMDWPKRTKIAIGAARGLTYLHEDCHPRIIHRDIKSANILLDDAFEAKVADFGLAKLTNDSLTHISTRVMGTFGYMAPEYAQSGKLTDRSDVFSFGVVLLELITGRKPVDASQPLGEESLVEWARLLLVDALETDDFREVADPALECRFSKTEMRRMVEAAAACVRHSAAKRPRMVQVWRSLDVDDCSSDLTNGVKLGQSMAYDSGRYSADIELFRRMAFANDLSTAELGVLDEDDHHSSKAGSSSSRHK
ncbi:unnamed protein product [Miscanthus lutarioriparius]|uniref:non-specific serine/threonine protein kinase n=1 Tax=Miscanthus lutarioriparius TaxID=422564 RepID=A0A811P5A5_9POAL|nr:unnamed protein product [Miscanthus lutarioriparius]